MEFKAILFLSNAQIQKNVKIIKKIIKIISTFNKINGKKYKKDKNVGE